MPIETVLLENQWIPFAECPECDKPFRPFLRGQVQRGPIGQLLAWIRGEQDWRGYCALICWECKEIVGYER